MKSILWGLLMVAISSSSPIKANEIIGELNSLSGYIGQDLKKENISEIEKKLQSEHFPVKALAISILYRYNQSKYEKALIETFAVHDYKEREAGKYNMIGQEEMIAAVEKIDNDYKDLKDTRLKFLLAFSSFKDANNWFEHNGQKVSAARFFRSAFLGAFWQGSGLDAVEITNKIDSLTEEGDLKTK